jgi:hypothetical protein
MLSPVPDIGEMARQPAGQEEDRVQADVVPWPGITWRQPLSGHRNPAQAVLVERHGGALLRRTRLDLDEGEYAPTAGDEVNLAASHTRSRCEDAPTMQTQPPSRQALGAPAALLGHGTPVQRLSSSARA